MSTLKQKPWWLRPFVGTYTWVTISPNIYYPSSLDPNQYPTIIEHEKIHIAQQDQMGLLKWLYKYFTSKPFRFDQEVAAFRVELLCMPLADRQFRINEVAGWLSGSMYSRCCTFDEAVVALSKDMLLS